MTSENNPPSESAEHLSETPHLAEALESDGFRQFLDHMPFGVAVSDLAPTETITYVNRGFERVIGKVCRRSPWQKLGCPARYVGGGRRRNASQRGHCQQG
jgi:PAS domain-containing protein